MTALAGLRICMPTSGHHPDDDRIFYKEARSLVRAGAAVTVLYPEGRPAPAQTGGVRFETYPGGGSLRRRAATRAILREAVAGIPADVIHCHEPDGLLAALAVKAERGTRVLYDSHEMWSAVAAQKFPRPLWGPVAATFKLLERRWIRRCDAAVGASWAISDYLRSCLDEARVATILNVPVTDVFQEAGAREWGERTLLCHDGHLDFNRGLKTMVVAAREVSRKHPVVLRIVGDVYGKERQWLEGYLKENACEGLVERTGWLPYEQVGQALAPCHIGLIALQNLPNNVVTSSNKVFNYMLYGIPFVAPAFRLSKIQLAREERCGLLADSADPRSYASAICGMIEDRSGTLAMMERARRASKERYRWEHMEPVLFSLYERVLA